MRYHTRLAPLTLAWLAALGGRAQPQATVSGGITDARKGASLPGATVQFSDSLSAETDAHGEFTLKAVPTRTYRVRLSRDGYRPKTLSVEIGRRDRRVYLVAALEPVVAEPESLVVKGDTTSVVAYEPYVGFYRWRHLGLGYSFTSRDIVRLEPQRVTDLLRPIPGVWFSYDRRGQVFLSFHLGPSPARGCSPTVYLDGAKAGSFISLDELVHPGGIEGLEVYTGLPFRPMDFPENCVIAVWTR